MLKPELAILDETDSGLDVDAVRTVSKGIEEYQKSSRGSLLIITPVSYTHLDVYKRQVHMCVPKHSVLLSVGCMAGKVVQVGERKEVSS